LSPLATTPASRALAHFGTRQSCSFKPTDKHPDSYSAQLRKAGADSPAIIYTTADATLPVQKTINGKLPQVCQAFRRKYDDALERYPSKTKPILLAKQVAAMKPKVVISAIWIPDLYTQVGKTYLDGCVPFLNMHNMPISFQVPGFRTASP